MIFLRVFLVLVLAVAVFWFGLTVGDELGRRTMPISEGIVIPTSEVIAASDFPPVGSTGQIRHPRFKVELVSINAVNETGWDWTGSDELRVVYDTQEHRIYTSNYEDVDAGDVIETRPTESCILPAATTDAFGNVWTCRPQGAAAPILFAVSLYEWDDPAPWGGFCVGLGSGGLLPAGTELPCNSHFDWLFSSRIYSYSKGELLERLPSPGTSFDVETGYIAHGFWDDWEYRLNIRITRVADYVEDRPVLR